MSRVEYTSENLSDQFTCGRLEGGLCNISDTWEYWFNLVGYRKKGKIWSYGGSRIDLKLARN